MNTLPSISAHIDEKIINKVIQDNFAALAPAYFTLTSNWFVRAYDHYKDIDKFVLIIYLIHQDLIYFRQNGVKIDYDTFYKDKPIEIDKINISSTEIRNLLSSGNIADATKLLGYPYFFEGKVIKGKKRGRKK